MRKEQWELQNGCDEIKKQLVIIDKTIKVLNEIRSMPVRVRNECSKDINKLINWIYE